MSNIKPRTEHVTDTAMTIMPPLLKPDPPDLESGIGKVFGINEAVVEVGEEEESDEGVAVGSSNRGMSRDKIATSD